MISKKNRNDRKAVAQIFKVGRTVGSLNLILKFFQTSTKNPPRISFVAPKTVAKRAVDRNLLRRRGYAVMERHLNKLPDGFSGIFIFGKKSMGIFGGHGKQTKDQLGSLQNEIKTILNKL